MLPSLLSPQSMPVIEGIRIPLNIYIILKEPMLLAGMSYFGMRTPWKKWLFAVLYRLKIIA